MTMPLAHFTVDVDPLRCYAEIHGLGDELATNAVYERAMFRFLALLDRYRVRATFFVVASDMERITNRGIIREAARRGHEIACHTLTHPYRFDQLADAQKEGEIARAVAILAEAAQAPIVGFRAPGYNFRPEMAPMLVRHGIRYDASVLPSRFYYLLRAAMIARVRLMGKLSGSQLGRYRSFAVSGAPSVVAHGGAVLREFPITVLPGVGLPMVGTFLNLLGPERLEGLLGFATRCDPLHVEFHGVDLLELARDGLDPAFEAQGDLPIPLERKVAVLETLLDFMTSRFEVTTLAEVSRGRHG